ncbi:replication-relaxation family protein [Paenibacillus vini]|uniref:replication-relaxation family protein n=1 Tax=Paenibacillus vini TaxID=1476024 RepID=UPI0025B7312C|nr:replication-relaxation family protein [Paenibacillus vini]MDN4067554.1 replication-relaxation family protein [Paenibacillus vini]
MALGNDVNGRSGDPTESKRKRNKLHDYSLGEVIDLLTEREWSFLTDLYLTRCMPQSIVVEYYFLDTPDFHYVEYKHATPDRKAELESKNVQRAIVRSRRTIKKLKDRGLLEASTFIPDSSDKPSHKRNGRIRGETWYYLSGRGLRIIEIKRGILEENRLSKHELDMERAKKDHFWELGKIYLELRFNLLANKNEYRQYDNWDWHPSLTVYSDNQINFVRPDAVLRIGQQVFFVELDRSTEPVQRSPFHSDQVSIERKLERYRDVLKLSTNKIVRNGVIAFVIPNAKQNTRLENIAKAAARVFGEENKVFTGKDIATIISLYSIWASKQPKK